MQEDGKTMQERLETILRESRLLAQDAGHRVASAARWAYHDVMRRFGWEEGGLEEEAASPPAPGAAQKAAPQSAAEEPLMSAEGYAAGQTWQPRDSSKKARYIKAIEPEGDDFFVVWTPVGGGRENRIKEASFTRWVRREHAALKKAA
ncbi:MAG TPA: hypothetical protein VJ985_05015 [Gammaproteobacteria bacterium]|nr:hypothetical protein [Gammaproteobacteria bacterium]